MFPIGCLVVVLWIVWWLYIRLFGGCIMSVWCLYYRLFGGGVIDCLVVVLNVWCLYYECLVHRGLTL